jgi:YHS domain-containing protein
MMPARLSARSFVRLLALSALGLAPTLAPAQSPNGVVFAPMLPGDEEAVTAMDGYCPVCIAEKKKKEWVPGDAKFASVVDGKRYLFPSAEVKAMFDADPAKYVPAAGGDCVVCMVEKHERMAGSAKHTARYKGRLFMFPSDEVKEMFLANPAKYAAADLAYGGDCAVCMVDMKHKNPGKPEFTAIYGGKRYLFPNDEKRQEFLADPMKYAEAM